MGYRLLGTNKKGVKKWCVYVELGKDIFGKRKKHEERFYGTLAEVKIKDAELTKQYYHKGKTANISNLTFAEYSNIFIKKYCEGKIGLVTIKNYKRILRTIIPYIGGRKLSKITTYMLDDMYKELRKGQKGKELSYNSMYDYYKLVNVMFNQAIKWEFITENPNAKVQKPKKQKVERKFYDLEQANLLLSCLENECIKYRALITLALDSGARRGEISALLWSDIDFENRTLNINKSLKVISKDKIDEKDVKTLSSNRTIILSESTIDVLKEYKEWQDNYIKELGSKWKGTNRVFTSEFGGHMNPSTCYKIFTKIVVKYNLEPIRFNDLRHTSASLLIHKGMNLKAVSERLGHSSINITNDIYTHTFESAKVECAMAFDDIFKNVQKTTKNT